MGKDSELHNPQLPWLMPSSSIGQMTGEHQGGESFFHELSGVSRWREGGSQGMPLAGTKSAWDGRPVWWLRIDALQATSRAKADFVSELS